ncbi:MAG: hypothetical protein H0T72_10160 [Chloroflexia bacterium]|jgi:hypothetical protein|nr:hypothetical protein [Chloroflexia bacterium]
MTNDLGRRNPPVGAGSAGPQNILAAISWTLLVTVMLGGYALLRLLSTGSNLTDHEEQFFRAGHGHAGVLAAVGILYSSYLGRTLLSARRQIVAWGVYLAGTLMLSGGMFIHMTVGEAGEGSWGTTLTAFGGVVLAITVLYLAWQLYQARHVSFVSSGSGTRMEGVPHE